MFIGTFCRSYSATRWTARARSSSALSYALPPKERGVGTPGPLLRLLSVAVFQTRCCLVAVKTDYRGKRRPPKLPPEGRFYERILVPKAGVEPARGSPPNRF